MVSGANILTQDEIQRVLSPSERWGANDMPKLEWVIELLKDLPLTDIRLVADDEITVWLTRELTMQESFKFYSEMTPNRLEHSNRGERPTFINVWWD